jgi:hypothetical protein
MNEAHRREDAERGDGSAHIVLREVKLVRAGATSPIHHALLCAKRMPWVFGALVSGPGWDISAANRTLIFEEDGALPPSVYLQVPRQKNRRLRKPVLLSGWSTPQPDHQAGSAETIHEGISVPLRPSSSGLQRIGAMLAFLAWNPASAMAG